MKDAARSADRCIDVTDGPIAPFLRIAVVFFARDIRSSLVQVLQRLVYASRMIRALIDRRVIADVLAVGVSRLLQVIDAGVDLPHGLDFIGRLRPVAGTDAR